MQTHHTRRAALRRAGIALAVAALPVARGVWGMTETAVSAADDFDALRLRWRDLLTGGSGYETRDPHIANAIAMLDARAASNWQRMDKTANRSALWHDFGPGTSASSYITDSHNRLADMARAYVTQGSLYAGDDRLLADTVGGLDFLNAHEYNETKPERGNWWDWEIGTPLALNNTVVLLYDYLAPDQIARYARAVEAFTPVPDIFNNGKTMSTGANRVWKAEVVAVRGVLVRDAAKITRARDSLATVFPFVTRGDGFYADGSFIQHGQHPYTGGYGTALMAELGNLLYLLGDTPYAVSDPGLANIWASVYDAYEPIIFRGALMDMMRGREISRSGTQDHAAGHAAIRAILTLAQAAPSADAAAFKSMVKGWITRDTVRDFLTTAPLNALLLARSVLDDPTIPPRAELTGHRQYAHMDRVVHCRPGWALGIAMSSERIFTYESINGENLHGWHTGDGMTYLYNGDLTQFSEDFWPTVNPYRLPGTTVVTRPRADGEGQSQIANPTPWVGGASLMGMYGAVGMDLFSDIGGRKSWFLLDDAVVCLGAGITSSADTRIETIIENRKLNARGDNVFTVDGMAKSANLGHTERLDGARWLHLAGVGGYIMDGQPIQALREARMGAWSAINKSSNASLPPIARNYLTLWRDHGMNPRDATYAYTLLPNASPDDTAACAADSDTRVVANTGRVQAIVSRRLRLVAANFWAAESVNIGTGIGTPVAFIRADTPASLIVQEDEGNLLLAVSDPTQHGVRIVVELGHAASTITSADATVTVTQLAPTIIVAIDVAGAGGATQSVSFALT